MNRMSGTTWLNIFLFLVILYIILGCSAYRPMTIETLNADLVELYGTSTPEGPPTGYDGTTTVDNSLQERRGVIYHSDGSRSYYMEH
jgi:hypothetical protein